MPRRCFLFTVEFGTRCVPLAGCPSRGEVSTFACAKERLMKILSFKTTFALALLVGIAFWAVDVSHAQLFRNPFPPQNARPPINNNPGGGANIGGGNVGNQGGNVGNQGGNVGNQGGNVGN